MTETRHPALLRLIKSLDALILISGVKDNCVRCWNGEFVPPPSGLKGWYPSHPLMERGCCGNCKHLSAIGCIAKPLACTLWLCSQSGKAVRGMGTPDATDLREFLWSIVQKLQREGFYGVVNSYRTQAYEYELAFKPSPEQRVALTSAYLRVRRYTRRIHRARKVRINFVPLSALTRVSSKGGIS